MAEPTFKCYRCDRPIEPPDIHVCPDLVDDGEGDPPIAHKPLCPDHGDTMNQYWLGVWRCCEEVDGGPNCDWLVMTAQAFAAWAGRGEGPLPGEHGLAPPPRERPDGAPCCWRCNDVGVIVMVSHAECTCKELAVPSLGPDLHDENCPMKHPGSLRQYVACPACFGYGECGVSDRDGPCSHPVAYNTLSRRLVCTAPQPHHHDQRYG